VKELLLFLVILVFGILYGLTGSLNQFQPVTTKSEPVTLKVPKPMPIAEVPSPTLVPSGLIERIVQVAQTWLDVRYVWGGCARSGVDCSCFVQNVYAAVGIHVPRTTVTQVAFDRLVSRDELRAGDTLFFDNTCTGCGPNPTHEGLYLGGGLMIDAGDPVKVETVYWNKFRSAGRPPGL
jgi:cell wall-associated NlpC family hydrolase